MPQAGSLLLVLNCWSRCFSLLLLSWMCALPFFPSISAQVALALYCSSCCRPHFSAQVRSFSSCCLGFQEPLLLFSSRPVSWVRCVLFCPAFPLPHHSSRQYPRPPVARRGSSIPTWTTRYTWRGSSLPSSKNLTWCTTASHQEHSPARIRPSGSYGSALHDPPFF